MGREAVHPGRRLAIVWVRAPDAATAAQLAHARVGPLGGWPTPPGCDDLEVFPRNAYAEHATPADYTHRARSPRA